MPCQGLDISWQVLRQITRDWAGSAAELTEVRPLQGGSVSATVALHTADGQRAVLKITPHRVDRTYADQAYQLEVLRGLGVPVPRVYKWVIGDLEHPFSYLLMEYVDGIDLAAVKACCAGDDFDAVQTELADLVLTLHANTSTHYRRVVPGEPKTFDVWPACYRDIYDSIWREMEKSGALAPKCRKTIAKVHARLDELLAHDDCPRLVHWDLWSTNLLLKAGPDGRWHVSALLDPNCKFAHAEAELAYLELFHTVNGAFLKSYQHVHRLSNDYHRVRKPVYQLYSLMNNRMIFGEKYAKLFDAAADRVAALV